MDNISLGIAALLLTPYLRVLVSSGYFAFVERDLKYTLFTTFVFAVLTLVVALTKFPEDVRPDLIR